MSDGKLDPRALAVRDAAKVLSAAARRRIAEEMIREDLEAGAPANPDGTVNLVHSAAWLVRELGSGHRPRNLRPSDLCRRLNSTPLGLVRWKRSRAVTTLAEKRRTFVQPIRHRQARIVVVMRTIWGGRAASAPVKLQLNGR